MINLYDFILEFYNKNFDNTFLFHNYNHFIEVKSRSLYLASKYNIDQKPLEVASLFHDLWLYNKKYEGHEERSKEIFMTWYKKKDDFSEKILLLIDATKVNKKVDSIEEKIIKDSDLDNLWTKDFFVKLKNLYEENINFWYEKNFDDFVYWVYNMFKDFSFYTDVQKFERLEKRKENFKILESYVYWKKDILYNLL